MRRVLSPSGTRLAPTEAARRPVACCFERPEQLRIFYHISKKKKSNNRYEKQKWGAIFKKSVQNLCDNTKKARKNQPLRIIRFLKPLSQQMFLVKEMVKRI